MKFKVLEVWEETNEEQDLSARAPGFFEGKESEGWREVSEALLNFRHEAGDLEIVYSKFLEVFEGEKVAEGALTEPFWSELGVSTRLQADPEPFDEGKQTELV